MPSLDRVGLDATVVKGPRGSTQAPPLAQPRVWGLLRDVGDDRDLGMTTLVRPSPARATAQEVAGRIG